MITFSTRLPPKKLIWCAKNHAIELNYEDTSRGIYYIVSWFALEIKLSEGWFERVRAEGHCWTSIKMSPHTTLSARTMQISPNLPLYAKLLPTGAISSRFIEGRAGQRYMLAVGYQIAHCTIIVFRISYFVFWLLHFIFWRCMPVVVVVHCLAIRCKTLVYITKAIFFFCKPQFYSQLLIFNTTLVCSELHSSDVLRSYRQP